MSTRIRFGILHRGAAERSIIAVLAVAVVALATLLLRDVDEVEHDGGAGDSGLADSNVTAAPEFETRPANTPIEASGDPASNPPVERSDVVHLTRQLSDIRWKDYIGQKVRLPGELVVVDNYNLARNGQISVAPRRLFVPTETIDPNDASAEGNSVSGKTNAKAVNQLQRTNNANWIVIEDGVKRSNQYPVPLVPAFGTDLPTLRLGSKVKNLVGTITEERGRYYLIPELPLDLVPAERPARPDVGAADVTVASFNVLNYFTTLDDGSNGARGADNRKEFERQTEKLVAAIVGLDADVIGLMELENNLKSEQSLVAAINRKLGKDVYVGCGLPDGFRDAPGGGDRIRVGMIYRRDRLNAVGAPEMIVDRAFSNARTPLLQTFRATEGEASFSVIVNHFKSKGSNEAAGANRDQRDGQGSYNDSRKSQAQALVNYLRDRKIETLVIGDLNAYSQEDPIDTLRAGGLVDVSQTKSTGQSYSYVYFGQAGSLDHCFATPALATKVTGIADWHINSDEPRCLDYNTEYGQGVYYRPDAFRCSDHDPVLIGLELR
ncbi:ExeM/NucH family extracellular endonuclease [Roseiconus lacunae]|uniref:ExeM/NucH family extracellular endonuclease n=1 Tax=Roseiconus lacunae TaxID=2605694 RepID=UPI0011F3F67E|nr:ExeM/NucH family extracellular endonuclease [Roseiconus lacunae]